MYASFSVLNKQLTFTTEGGRNWHGDGHPMDAYQNKVGHAIKRDLEVGMLALSYST